MDIVTWMLAGAGLGWITFSYLSLNAERGLIVSIIIGAVGGLIGGKLIAPMFTSASTAAAGQAELSIATVFFAGAAAAAALAAGNLVHKRWGV